MTTWRFFAAGTPKGQPRPRAFARNGHVRVYDPGTAENWKAQIALAAREAGLAGLRLAGPVELRVEFLMPRPKRLLGKRAEPWRIPHVSKPDLDNLTKGVMDACTAVEVWLDDSQVYEVIASKHYTELGAHCGAWISVEGE